MGGFVEVLSRNGGMTALSRRVMGQSRSPRRAGMGAYFMGWVVFFDGLASSVLVGKTMKPIADRAGLSREKLAFIVDSTSSPIAGLALLSTWVAYEMSVIRQGFTNTGDPLLVDGVAPFSWLVLSLPFRFYNWFMLLLVFLLVWFMRDWGPMLVAEKANRLKPRSEDNLTDETKGSTIALALVPLGVLVLAVFGGLFISGGGWKRSFTLGNLVEALSKADAAAVFVLATALASAVALGLTALQRRGNQGPLVSSETGTQAFLQGMQQLFLPTLILVFAWMLNSVIKELGAVNYLVSLLGDRLPASWLPALVFLLASVISFSTGTSWGTMAIVMPLAIPLAVKVSGYQSGMTETPILVGTVGAVLSGAVFGDHCSPISDTTLVSAFSSGCEVMAHVRTQLPYALTAAFIAMFLGYLPAGYGIGPWWLLGVGSLTCCLLVGYFGKKVT